MGAGISPELIAAILAQLQGQGGRQGQDTFNLNPPLQPIEPDFPDLTPTAPEGGGGGKLDAFLGSPTGALVAQLAGGLGEGLLSRPSKEERELSRARTESLGVGSAAQNSQAFQQLMQLLLRSSGRGGL